MRESGQSVVSPHGIQWYFAAPRQAQTQRHDPFRSLQKRFNEMLGQHPAITRNTYLDILEEGHCSLPAFLHTLNQQAIAWHTLVRVREHHAARCAEQNLLTSLPADSLPVAVCFDSAGVPWCPPVPEGGFGDPFALDERLHEWWGAWQWSFPALAGKAYALGDASPATRALCDHIDQFYNALDPHVALGTMVALESALSTDCWERLRRAGERFCQRMGRPFPLSGFLITSEMHARLQSRHAIRLLDQRSGELTQDEVAVIFDAMRSLLDVLSEFDVDQAESLRGGQH